METKSFTVYGLRCRGEREVRYVGQTSLQPGERLAGHFQLAQKPDGHPAVYNRALAEWLRETGSDVEAFAIAKVLSRAESLSHERAIIGLCQRLNQRLFNLRGRSL